MLLALLVMLPAVLVILLAVLLNAAGSPTRHGRFATSEKLAVSGAGTLLTLLLLLVVLLIVLTIVLLVVLLMVLLYILLLVYTHLFSIIFYCLILVLANAQETSSILNELFFYGMPRSLVCP